MRSHRKWQRRRLGTVSVLAAVLIGAAALAAIPEEPSKPGPTTAEGGASTSPVPPEDERAPARPPAAVPARAQAPSGVECAPGWTYFDNPVMHYGICVPPGWGFSDFSSPDPMDSVPGAELQSLHLLSARAFPWTRGRLPFDAIMAGGVQEAELDVLPAGTKTTTECEPSDRIETAAGTARTCEQFYDVMGLPAPSGPLRALKVIVPLLQTPSYDPGGNLDGARLLMVVRARASASAKEVETLWQLVRSVYAY